MTWSWYDDPWADDLESWEELNGLLRDDWDRIEHPPLGLSLEPADGLAAFDLHGRWRARHRSGLHQLGFRPVAVDRLNVWVWDVEPQLRTTDLSRFAHPLESIFRSRSPAVEAARTLRLRRTLAREHLVREQALRVLRDVFHCQVEDLAVRLVREDEEWEDEGDAWTLHSA